MILIPSLICQSLNISLNKKLGNDTTIYKEWKPTLAGALDVKAWTRGEDMNLEVREISLDCSGGHLRIII